MKRIAIPILAFAIVLAGCSQEAPVTKDEQKALTNPSKVMPKEAAEAMAQMGKGPTASDKIKMSAKGNY